MLAVIAPAFLTSCKKSSSDDASDPTTYEAVQVSGAVKVPGGVTVDYTSMEVHGGAITSASPEASGQFTINLNKNTTQLVSAVQSNGTPMLLNIVINPQSTDSVILNARTTARSLIFLHPAAVVSDPAMSNTVMGIIDSLPGTAQLTMLLVSKLQKDPDILYTEDAAIQSAIKAAVIQLLAQIDGLKANLSLNDALQIEKFKEMKHLGYPPAGQKPEAPYASGDLVVTPSGPQSGITVNAVKQSDTKYQVQVTNTKKRYVNVFLDDVAGGNIGSALLPSIKSSFDWQPLAPSKATISPELDIIAHPTSVVYAYGLGAQKHAELLNSPLYGDRTLEPVIYTAVFDFLFPLVDVISGVKGFKNTSPGTDPTGVMTYIIAQMNKDGSLKGQLIAHLETGNFSEMLATAIKGGMQVFIGNPTLLLQYVKKKAMGAVLFQVLTPMLVAPLRVILLSFSSMDLLTATYGLATSAWVEKWTLSKGGMYDGTWTGTFYYTATIPNSSGPPTVVNKSFNLTITLVSVAAVPGVPQVLNVTSVSCDDQTFGALSAVVPTAPLSIAILPAAFGSPSASGQGIIIMFPNGANIGTNNSFDGSFTVDAAGNVLASTSLVSSSAFTASGPVENSNLPGSGPGGYAYNWCKFTSWKLTRQ